MIFISIFFIASSVCCLSASSVCCLFFLSFVIGVLVVIFFKEQSLMILFLFFFLGLYRWLASVSYFFAILLVAVVVVEKKMALVWINKPFCIVKRENILFYFINFSLHKDWYNFYRLDLIRYFLNTVKQNFNPTTETSTFYASYEYVCLNEDGSIRNFNFKISKIFNGQYFNDFIISQISDDVAINV